MFLFFEIDVKCFEKIFGKKYFLFLAREKNNSAPFAPTEKTFCGG